MKLFRITVTAAFAALLVSATLLTSPMIAQDKMGGKMSGKTAGPMFVCKECKMGYTAAQSKMMGGKDKMGTKLVKMSGKTGTPP